jgi:membrane dipeptidase
MAAGKISAFLGIEGGEAIANDINNIDYFYNNGVRYMSLTWNKSNRLAEAAMAPRKTYHGLTALGVQIVKRMNQVGMIIDISHASGATVSDILKISRAPIIASHSCCNALRRHPRNLTDNQIKAICAGGGIIGMNFHRKHLTAKNKATVSDVANHLDHLVKVGGISCAALGSDFDGDIVTPVGLENIGKLSNLTQELIKRGYKKEDIEKIYGLNFLNFLQKMVDEKAGNY